MISKNGITFEYKAEIQLRIQLLFCSGVQHCASDFLRPSQAQPGCCDLLQRGTGSDFVAWMESGMKHTTIAMHSAARQLRVEPFLLRAGTQEAFALPGVFFSARACVLRAAYALQKVG